LPLVLVVTYLLLLVISTETWYLRFTPIDESMVTRSTFTPP